MLSIFLALLISVLITAHLRVPYALLNMLQKVQADFDGQIFNGLSCRSAVDEIAKGVKRRRFAFFNQEEAPCYIERIDFGTVETRSYWPKSVCLLLNPAHGSQNSLHSQHSLGDPQCDYR